MPSSRVVRASVDVDRHGMANRVRTVTGMGSHHLNVAHSRRASGTTFDFVDNSLDDVDKAESMDD
jgi:hypothetical protein